MTQRLWPICLPVFCLIPWTKKSDQEGRNPKMITRRYANFFAIKMRYILLKLALLITNMTNSDLLITILYTVQCYKIYIISVISFNHPTFGCSPCLAVPGTHRKTAGRWDCHYARSRQWETKSSSGPCFLFFNSDQWSVFHGPNDVFKFRCQ